MDMGRRDGEGNRRRTILTLPRLFRRDGTGLACEPSSWSIGVSRRSELDRDREAVPEVEHDLAVALDDELLIEDTLGARPERAALETLHVEPVLPPR